MLFHSGTTKNAENIQINKVIGENFKNVSFILWKKLNRFFG